MTGKDHGPHPVHNRSNPSRKLGVLTFASPDDPPLYAFTPDIASMLGFIDVLSPDREIFQARDITFPNDRQTISSDKVLAILQGIPPDAEWPDRASYPAYLFANSGWHCDLLQSRDPGYKRETCFWTEIRVDDIPGQFQLPSGLCWRHRHLLPDPSLLVKIINLVNTPDRVQWGNWRREGFPPKTQQVRTSTAIYILESRESTVIDKWCGRANSDMASQGNPLPSPPLSASPIINEQALVLSRRALPSSTSVDRSKPPAPSHGYTPNRTPERWDDFQPDHSISSDNSLLLISNARSGTSSRSVSAIETAQLRLEMEQKQLVAEKEHQLKSSVADLERRLSRTEDERDLAVKELMLTRGRLAGVRDDYLEERLYKLDDEANMLAGRLQRAEEELRAEKASVVRREAIIGDLKRQLEEDSMAGENASLREEMAHLRYSAKMVNDLEGELRSARTQITQLKSDWTTARRDASSSTEQYRAARNELESAKKAVLEERDKNKAKDRLVVNLEVKFRDKAALADRSVRDLAAAKCLAASLEEKNATLQKRLDDWERKGEANVAKASVPSEEARSHPDDADQPINLDGAVDSMVRQDDVVNHGWVTVVAEESMSNSDDHNNDEDLVDFSDLDEDSSEDEKEDCDDDYVPPDGSGIQDPEHLVIAAEAKPRRGEDTKNAKSGLPLDANVDSVPSGESLVDLEQKLKEERRAHARTKQQLYEMERDCLISMRALNAAQKRARGLEKSGKQVVMGNAVKEVSIGDLQWYYKRKVSEMKINPANTDMLSQLLEDEMEFGGGTAETVSLASLSPRKRRRCR